MVPKRKCCVPGCEDIHSKRHRFPKNPLLKKIWLYKINNPTLSGKTTDQIRNSIVCHRHFENKFLNPGFKRGLTCYAYPTLFLPDPQCSISVTELHKMDTTVSHSPTSQEVSPSTRILTSSLVPNSFGSSTICKQKYCIKRELTCNTYPKLFLPKPRSSVTAAKLPTTVIPFPSSEEVLSSNSKSNLLFTTIPSESVPSSTEHLSSSFDATSSSSLTVRKQKCCVPNCEDVISKRHRFPKDPLLKEAWLCKINNPTLFGKTTDQLKSYKVCHRHFEKKFFNPGFRRNIIYTAYPTLFLPEQRLPSPANLEDNLHLSSASVLPIVSAENLSYTSVSAVTSSEDMFLVFADNLPIASEEIVTSI